MMTPVYAFSYSMAVVASERAVSLAIERNHHLRYTTLPPDLSSIGSSITVAPRQTVVSLPESC